MEQDVARTTDAFPPTDKGPIERVRKGMKVFDSAGEELGKVDVVKMGDPRATTTEGQEMTERNDLIDFFAEAISGGSNVPPEMAARLMRIGFIHIDGKGWIDTDRY
ncbi:MAG: hypothetical protein ACRDJH_07890, partial [Thermomicrobiales bacterium]